MSCSSGGPQIDFRGGRVTATKADSPGVPEAQDPIKSHTDAFARMGFTKNEMIGLVACGHTIGGVQHAAAPDIVPASAVDPELNPDGNLVFDSSFDVFDNKMCVLLYHLSKCLNAYSPLLVQLTMWPAGVLIH
jgi:hypothetical protein